MLLGTFRRVVSVRSCSSHHPARYPFSSFGSASRCATTGHQKLSVEQLQRRFIRLKGFLGKVRWPVITNFQAFGEQHQLPLLARFSPGVLKEPTLDELAYMSGFFDGDGCVSPTTHLSGCQLFLAQSSDHGEALLLFHQVFGGSIMASRRGIGSQRPVIRWSLYGQAARKAAALLSKASYVKRAQLQIAAGWPSCKIEREKLAITMSALKRSSHPLHGTGCSWAYVAGFFDADGHMVISADGSGIRLVFSQKHASILETIREFLAQEGYFDGIGMDHNFEMSRLGVYGSKLSCKILEHMIAAGMIVKRSAAEVVLKTSNSNYLRSRVELAGLVGNQGRYRRHGELGCQRAKTLASLQRKLWYLKSRGRFGELAPLEDQLLSLKQEHCLRHAEASVSLLRRDIRLLLRQGAGVTQVSSAYIKC
ncbi:unnamed protein product [Polarella glacialis]|uniref:DOD-type homing endonuclease domain-containing protein n=1 Tax=Polarella glacialis TaxID=89957 RepID=A0A813HT30_POLGL|nr:unnamed protein product [Polarella glacialis]